MKGIFKGFKYISQIFEPNGKEQEMQIGFPTDVRHVAHIGWDGPSVTPPSWMNDFKSAPLSTMGSEAMGDITGSTPKYPSHDLGLSGGPTNPADAPEPLPPPKHSRRNRSVTESPLGDSPVRDPDLPRPSRRHASSGAAGVDSPSPDRPRHSRRNKSTDASLLEDPSEGSTRRRQSRVKEQGGAEPADLPSIPKQTKKKKKSKGGMSGDGSSRSASRSKALEEASGAEERGVAGEGAAAALPAAAAMVMSTIDEERHVM